MGRRANGKEGRGCRTRPGKAPALDSMPTQHARVAAHRNSAEWSTAGPGAGMRRQRASQFPSTPSGPGRRLPVIACSATLVRRKELPAATVHWLVRGPALEMPHCPDCNGSSFTQCRRHSFQKAFGDRSAAATAPTAPAERRKMFAGATGHAARGDQSSTAHRVEWWGHGARLLDHAARPMKTGVAVRRPPAKDVSNGEAFDGRWPTGRSMLSPMTTL